MDFNPEGSSAHGILQARILEWVAISYLKGLPNPGIKPRSPALQADSLLSEPPGKPSCGAQASNCDGFCCGTWALGAWASVVVACGLSLLCGMWDLPGPGIKSMSPALAGGFFTSEPIKEALY